MTYIELGSNAIGSPDIEAYINIVIAAKSEANDLEDFIAKTADYFVNVRGWKETIRELFAENEHTPATEECKEQIAADMEQMKKNAYSYIAFEEIKKAVHVMKPEWNDTDYAIETENFYIYYEWGTTA